VHRGVDLREDAACVLEEGLACRQQAHAAGGSLEEPGAQFVLEREDVTAERRLREVEPARGAPHVALFSHRDKGLDVRETHAGED
jgi:hypothetical protein